MVPLRQEEDILVVEAVFLQGERGKEGRREGGREGEEERRREGEGEGGGVFCFQTQKPCDYMAAIAN